eukprot:Ihof_evm8s127 gene=Ihof_evmTU8s127
MSKSYGNNHPYGGTHRTYYNDPDRKIEAPYPPRHLYGSPSQSFSPRIGPPNNIPDYYGTSPNMNYACTQSLPPYVQGPSFHPPDHRYSYYSKKYDSSYRTGHPEDYQRRPAQLPPPTQGRDYVVSSPPNRNLYTAPMYPSNNQPAKEISSHHPQPQEQVSRSSVNTTVPITYRLGTHDGCITFEDASKVILKRCQLEKFFSTNDSKNNSEAQSQKLMGLLVKVNAGIQGQNTGYVIVQIISAPNPEQRNGQPGIEIKHLNDKAFIPLVSVSNSEATREDWVRSRVRISSMELPIMRYRYGQTFGSYSQPPPAINLNSNYQFQIQAHPQSTGTMPPTTSSNIAQSQYQGYADNSLPPQQEKDKATQPSPVIPVKARTYLDTVEDENSEAVAMEKLTFTLRCPITLSRMKCPVKGKDCSHQACFDRDTFIQYSKQRRKKERKPMCPICKSIINSTEELVEDVALKKILTEMEGLKRKRDDGSNDDDSLMQVTVFKDGTWEPANDHASKRLKGDMDQ